VVATITRTGSSVPGFSLVQPPPVDGNGYELDTLRHESFIPRLRRHANSAVINAMPQIVDAGLRAFNNGYKRVRGGVSHLLDDDVIGWGFHEPPANPNRIRRVSAAVANSVNRHMSVTPQSMTPVIDSLGGYFDDDEL